MIDTIVFDIGNVLTRFSWDTYIQQFGLDERDSYEVAKASVLSPEWNEFDRGVLTDEEIISSFVKNAPQYADCLRRMFRDMHGLVTRAEYAIPWIDALKAAGYRVLVLSNFPETAHRHCMDALDFLPHTDGGILSYQEHVIKPDPAIYRLLAERYGLQFSHCVFVDDKEENLVPARELGMKTIQFRNYEQGKKELDEMLNCYHVRTMTEPVNRCVTVPGSKSMTNRALFMAAMAEGTSVLKGVLLSEDAQMFLGCLRNLGFPLTVDAENGTVTLTGMGGRIPVKNAEIYVGSAGTAARFLTAMLALGDSEATIRCSEQMSRRPMRALFDALQELGAEFTYLGEEGFLPVRVGGCGRKPVTDTVSVDISESTQFLSALLMSAPLLEAGLKIRITSEKKTGSYVTITRRMMKDFGVEASFDGADYTVGASEHYRPGIYQIEPDVSAACYFYGLAALTGSSMLVRNVHRDSMQGDIRFLEILETIGCRVTDEAEGIQVTGRADRQYPGITVDMNDFSDQTMTVAAMAPYFNGTTRICNVGHIRKQESDRMQAIVNELTRTGVACRTEGDDLIIEPGIPHGARIRTYDDHRVAMAFSLMGLRTDGIVITDYRCCKKTFRNYFDVLDSLYEVDADRFVVS